MIPVILSGGSGTRLWPVSRASYPKQFCNFYDESFLDHTIARLRDLGEIHILTTRTMEALTHRAVRRALGNLNPQNLIFEPMGKNTGPAVALLCHILAMRGAADQVVGVFPSDHFIADEKVFQRAVRLAESVAARGFVITLGVQPHYASTGYGYIEVGGEDVGREEAGLPGAADRSDRLSAVQVLGFREKPNLRTAESYLASGRHCWNAGMFVFRIKEMIEHFATWQPQLWAKIREIDSDLENAHYNYAMVESISLDYAIMEKLKRQACIPCDMGWSDVGSWDEVARLSEEAPEVASKSQAQIFNQDSENNYVFSVNNKIVGLVDVSDIIIVDTPDALLVTRKGSSQKVKELVETMKEAGLPEATVHPFETRPWGRFEVLADERDFKVKRITVDPGARLSYQSHGKRAEHWVMISGEGEVTLDDKLRRVKAGDSIYIPVGAKHRIHNTETVPMVFVEVQTGNYFGEEDIVRYMDDYNRTTN